MMKLYLTQYESINDTVYMVRKTKPKNAMLFWKNPVFAEIDTDNLQWEILPNDEEHHETDR